MDFLPTLDPSFFVFCRGTYVLLMSEDLTVRYDTKTAIVDTCGIYYELPASFLYPIPYRTALMILPFSFTREQYINDRQSFYRAKGIPAPMGKKTSHALILFLIPLLCCSIGLSLVGFFLLFEYLYAVYFSFAYAAGGVRADVLTVLITNLFHNTSDYVCCSTVAIWIMFQLTDGLFIAAIRSIEQNILIGAILFSLYACGRASQQWFVAGFHERDRADVALLIERAHLFPIDEAAALQN